MQALASFCTRRPVFASMFIGVLVVAGLAGYSSLSIDRYPQVELPTVRVSVSLPGASPEEMEVEVAQPIEEAVNTIAGIEELRSISGNGQTNVIIVFALNRDIDAATQDVRDRIAAVARRLPEDASVPLVSKSDADAEPVMSIALSGPYTLRELTDIAEREVKPLLDTADGVGEVRVVGGLQRSVNVWLDADRLAAYEMPIDRIRTALVNQNANVPGGNLTGPVVEQSLRTMGRISRVEQFEDLIVSLRGTAPVRLSDIARVEDGHKELRAFSRLDGEPTVTLQIRRQSGSNTVSVIDAVQDRLVRIRQIVPPGARLEVIEDQSVYIRAAMKEVNSHLIAGSILAGLTVLLFMRSWRSTLIAAVAIPTSIITTFAVMKQLDFTLNSVTMLSLVLMVGIVIDDAIVVLENIFRFIEEKGMPPLQAAIEATREIGPAVMATTLSLVVIFVPVSFMSSVSGRFLYQFGITSAVAILVSLLVSFTLTPMMSARLLRRGDAQAGAAPATRGGAYGWLQAGYLWLLGRCLRYRWLSLAFGLGIVASSVPLYQAVKMEFIPSNVDEGEFQIRLTAAEGTSLLRMDELTRRVEQRLSDDPRIVQQLTTVGGGWLGDVNTSRIFVRLEPHEKRIFSFSRLFDGLIRLDPAAAWRGNYTQSDVMSDLRRDLRGLVPGVRAGVRSNRSFNFGAGGGGFDMDIAFQGPRVEDLAAYAAELLQRSRSLPGVVDPDLTLQVNKPELQVEIDREMAADRGLDPRDIAAALRVLVGGQSDITRFRDPDVNEFYDVQLRLPAEDRDDVGKIEQLYITTADGRAVSLGSVVRFRETTAPARIDRADRQREARFRAGLAPGYGLTDVVAAVRQEIDDMNLPPAYNVTVRGSSREFNRTYNEFLIALALSVLLMYMIIAAQYESIVDPVTILLAIPLCIPFALLSIYLADETLNLYSALGVLVLFGVVKKNSILQVDHINQVRLHEPDRTLAILDACRDRLRPILMTTISFVAGMLPLAMGTGPGAEERRTISIVVIGGQTLSLLLTLLITPVAYTFLDDLSRRGRGPTPPQDELAVGMAATAGAAIEGQSSTPAPSP